MSRSDAKRLGHFSTQCNGGHRACSDTGEAFLAGDIEDGLLAIETDHCLETPPGKGHEGRFIPGLAYVNAPTAQDASVWIIIKKGMFSLNVWLLQDRVETPGLETHLEKPGDSLEFACLVGRTVCTVHLMDRHEELKGVSLKFAHRGRIGSDRHAVHSPGGARRYGPCLTLNLNKTESAGGLRRFQGLHIAKIGDVYPIVQAGLQDACPGFDPNFPIVNRQRDHIFDRIRPV